MKDFLAVLHARNLEFLRDRSALSWNVVFPFLLVFGFSILFSDDSRPMYKVGVIGEVSDYQSLPFMSTRFIEFLPFSNIDKAVEKVDRHSIDMLLTLQPQPGYWINSTSPNGYILEQMFIGAQGKRQFDRQEVHGREIRYVDWIVPGVLGLNIMISCLFGVGYVIVRYRKNGFLKRLKATPLSPFKFLLAQLVSRLLLIQSITVFVYIGCDFFLDFQMRGSYLNLFFLSLLSAMCMIAFGLLIAARLKSEEFAGGILNMTTWPMMLLSGVWFSLEGSPQWVQWISQALPLTHMVDGARAIMSDGAGFSDIASHYGILSVMTILFLGLGSAIFRWE
ncbi:MAG: ABC transporter permease [Gammaproteobacteria bacterium]|nr:ABC transporter permease [Gammaproteobacteria bacterium]